MIEKYMKDFGEILKEQREIFSNKEISDDLASKMILQHINSLLELIEVFNKDM